MSDLSTDRVIRSVERNTEEVPASSMPETGQSSDDPATANPQTQEFADISNRIPSYVFSRTSTGTVPREWSTCSNESLFSINSGNMSFTRDQMNSMKSGDLSYCYDPTKDQLNWMKSFKVNQSCDSTHSGTHSGGPSSEAPYKNQTRQSGCSNEGWEVAETTGKVSTQHHNDGVPQELPHSDAKESQHRKDGVPRELSHSDAKESQHHMDNVKSFAFPILTGNANKNESLTRNANKNESLTRNAKNKEQQPVCSTSRRTPEIPADTGNETHTTPSENPKEESPIETKENTDETPESPKEAMKSHTTKVNKDGGLTKWFSCFSCCSSGS